MIYEDSTKKLKPKTFMCQELTLAHLDFDRIQDDFKAKVLSQPTIYKNLNVIFNLNELQFKNTESEIMLLKEGVEKLRDININVVGIVGVHSSTSDEVGLRSVMPTNKKEEAPIKVEPCIKDTAAELIKNNKSTEVYTRSIRSGEAIHSEKDLIIFGDVKNGAEVSSAGHLIVCGKLLGKAMAGSHGASCIILAKQFSPEITSISGVFTANADISEEYRGKSVLVQKSLNNEILMFNLY